MLLGIALQSRATPHLKEGLIALKQGDLNQAKQQLEQARDADSNNAYVWTSLAQTYLRLNNTADAESAAAKALKLSSKDPVIVHALGIFYFEYAETLLRKQEFTRASDVLNQALEADPTNAQLVLALGVARYGQRRFEEAIAAFLKVIQLDPALEQPYVFLGKMLDQAGSRLPEITRDYEAWFEREPHNAKAPLLLAKVLLLADSRSARAAELLRTSIALDSRDWESHYELGVLLANSRDYRSAADELNRSIELNSTQAMTHYHLARVYERLGQPDLARAERETHQRLTNTAPR